MTCPGTPCGWNNESAGFTGWGKKSDVHIYNFATLNTIEEHIIWLLHEKIDLFRSVIGELEVILEKMDWEKDVEQNIMRVWLEAKDDEEVRKQLSKWGDAFFETKKRS